MTINHTGNLILLPHLSLRFLSSKDKKSSEPHLSLQTAHNDLCNSLILIFIIVYSFFSSDNHISLKKYFRKQQTLHFLCLFIFYFSLLHSLDGQWSYFSLWIRNFCKLGFNLEPIVQTKRKVRSLSWIDSKILQSSSCVAMRSVEIIKRQISGYGIFKLDTGKPYYDKIVGIYVAVRDCVSVWDLFSTAFPTIHQQFHCDQGIL